MNQGLQGGYPPSPTRFFDTPIATVINAVACTIGALSLTAAIVLSILTFFDKSPFGTGEFVPSFTLIFPLWGWGFVVLAGNGLVRTRRRTPFATGAGFGGSRSIMGLAPLRARRVVPILVCAGLVSAASSLNSLGGQPEFDASTHKFALDDHGVLTDVSYAAYVHAVALQNRLFLSGAIVFSSLATAVALGEWQRRRAAPSVRWPEPTVARARLVPPLGLATSILALGVAGVALFGSAIIVRDSAYTGDAVHLVANGTTVASLTAGDYVVFAGCTEDIQCPSVGPANVVVRSGSESIRTTPDPSNDRLTFGDQPFVGVLSFQVNTAARYALATTVSGKPKLVVLHSPGQEALALSGWIVGAIGSALVALLGVISCIAWLVWRFSKSPRTPPSPASTWG